MGAKTIDITIGCATARVAFTCATTVKVLTDFSDDFNGDFGTTLTNENT